MNQPLTHRERTPVRIAPKLALGMMAKDWIPGQVKTRLARDTGDLAASEIHKHFTLRLGKRLAKVADYRCVFVSPDDACERMQTAIAPDWLALPQHDGDLGYRMKHAFQTLFLKCDPANASQVVLIGADLPTLSAAELDMAFASLDAHDVVLGPAMDGGYYAIGLRGPWRAAYEGLFEAIAWSTEQVFEQTKQVIQNAGLNLAVLGMREDIDTLESLHRLLQADATEPELKSEIQSVLSVPAPSTFNLHSQYKP